MRRGLVLVLILGVASAASEPKSARCELDLTSYAELLSPMQLGGSEEAPVLSSRGAWHGGLAEYVLPPCALRMANVSTFELRALVSRTGDSQKMCNLTLNMQPVALAPRSSSEVLLTRRNARRLHCGGRSSR